MRDHASGHWATSTRTKLSAVEHARDPKPGDLGIHDFGYGVEYDANQDVLTLTTGTNSDLSIRPGRKLAEILAAGFAAAEQEEAAAEPEQAYSCRYCGKTIRWTKLHDPKGRAHWHPLDYAPSKHGTIVLESDGGHAHMLKPMTAPTGPLFQSHLETCPGMAASDTGTWGPKP